MYLLHLLKPVGGKFFLNCNYEVSDYTISSQFYKELLSWWSEFRESFASESDCKIIWNNKEIQIDNKPLYYKKFFNSGIIYIHDLLFNLNTIDSYNYFSNKTGNKVWIICLMLALLLTPSSFWVMNYEQIYRMKTKLIWWGFQVPFYA